jgi:hypothetical protein
MKQSELNIKFGTNDKIYQGRNLIYLIGIISQILLLLAWFNLKFLIQLLLIQIFLPIILFSIIQAYNIHIYKKMKNQTVIAKIYWDNYNKFEEIIHIKSNPSFKIRDHKMELILKKKVTNASISIQKDEKIKKLLDQKIFNHDINSLKIYHLDLLNSLILSIESFFLEKKKVIIIKDFIIVSSERPNFINNYETKTVNIKGLEIKHQIHNLELVLIGHAKSGVPIFFELDSENVVSILLNERLNLVGLSKLNEMIIQQLNLEYSHIIERTKKLLENMKSQKEISEYSLKKIQNSLKYFK